MKKVTKKVVEPWKAYGILNAYGEPWTYKVFDTPLEAEYYMETFWIDMKNRPDMSKHRVIPVEIHYSPKE